MASPLTSTPLRFQCAMRSVSNSRITSSSPGRPPDIGPHRAPDNRGGRYGAIALDNLTHFNNDPVSRGSEGKVIMGAPSL